jgi:hypothetical protein
VCELVTDDVRWGAHGPTWTSRSVLFLGYTCYGILVGGILILSQSIFDTRLPNAPLLGSASVMLTIIAYSFAYKPLVRMLGFLGSWELSDIRATPEHIAFMMPDIAVFVVPVLAGIVLICASSLVSHRISDF